MNLIISIGNRSEQGLIIYIFSILKYLYKKRPIRFPTHLHIFSSTQYPNKFIRLKNFLSSFDDDLAKFGRPMSAKDKSFEIKFRNLLRSSSFMSLDNLNTLLSTIKKKNRTNFAVVGPFDGVKDETFQNIPESQNIIYLRFSYFEPTTYFVTNSQFRNERFHNDSFFLSKEELIEYQKVQISRGFSSIQTPISNVGISIMAFVKKYPLLDKLLHNEKLPQNEKSIIIDEIVPKLITFHYMMFNPTKNIYASENDIKVYLFYIGEREKKVKIKEILSQIKQRFNLNEDTCKNIIKNKFPQFKAIYGDIILAILYGKKGYRENLPSKIEYERYQLELWFVLTNIITTDHDDYQYLAAILITQMHLMGSTDPIYTINQEFKDYLRSFFSKYYPLLERYIEMKELAYDPGELFPDWGLCIDLMIYESMFRKGTPDPARMVKDIWGLLLFHLHGSPTKKIAKISNIKKESLSVRYLRKYGKISKITQVFRFIFEDLGPLK